MSTKLTQRHIDLLGRLAVSNPRPHHRAREPKTWQRLAQRGFVKPHPDYPDYVIVTEAGLEYLAAFLDQ